MAIEPPTRFVVNNYRPVNTEVPSPLWKVMVPPSQSLEWCVTLSYLKSSKNKKKNNDFQARLKSLIVNKVSAKNVKRSVLKYNPFLNRYFCFYDDALKQVVTEFEEKLKQTCTRAEYKKENILDTVCSLLNCKVVEFIMKEDMLVETREFSSPSSPDRKRLPTIYLTCNNIDDFERFAFFLKDADCVVLQEKALCCILRRTELSHKCKHKIIRKCVKSQNFVISLFKNYLSAYIPEIYKYPYIAGQLASAGYETDPRVLDSNGNSAFFHAFRCKGNELLYILYIYAANNCHSSRGTYRNPDAKIVSNLYDLGEIIKNDSFRSEGEEEHFKSEGLLLFNKFLTEVHQQIFSLQEEINFSDKVSDENFIRSKRLRKFILILKVYKEYFWIKTPEKIHDGSHWENSNYIEHIFYYNILDFSTALIFFDSIFSLRRLLISYYDTYCFKLETDFFFVLLNYRYLPREISIKNIKYNNFATISLPSISKKKVGMENFHHLSAFAALERSQLLRSVEEFCEQLERLLKEERVISKDKTVWKPLDWPVIKDEFMICRLRYYTSIASKVKFDSLKSVLSIQRALLVLGESLKFDSQNVEYFSHLLHCCIPTETANILNDVRNALSHLDCFKFVEKFNTEKNFLFFKSIQKELEDIMKTFSEVFDLQQPRLLVFLKKRWKNFLEKVKNTSGGKMGEELQIPASLISELENFLVEKMPADDEVDDNFIFYKHFLKKNSSLNAYPKCENIKKLLTTLMSEDNEKRAAISRKKKMNSDFFKTFILNNDRYTGPRTSQDSEKTDILIPSETVQNPKEKISNQNIQKETLTSAELQAIPIQLVGQSFFENSLSENDDSFAQKCYSKTKDSTDNQKSLESKSFLYPKPYFPMKTTAAVNNVTNLVNRIELLEALMLEDSNCKELWEKGKSKKAEDHLVIKIAQRYLREQDFQASIEMLLFDCFTIMQECPEESKKKRKTKRGKCVHLELKMLWHKISKLYNGISVRNVLAHGDIFLEVISDFLDPNDFPSELARKLLRLLEDKKALKAMDGLWQSVECNEQHFTKIIHGEDLVQCSVEQNEMRLKIRECKRWNDYHSHLLKKGSEPVEGKC